MHFASFPLLMGTDIVPGPFTLPHHPIPLTNRVRTVAFSNHGIEWIDFLSFGNQFGRVWKAQWRPYHGRITYHHMKDTWRCFEELESKGYVVAIIVVGAHSSKDQGFSGINCRRKAIQQYLYFPRQTIKWNQRTEFCIFHSYD